MYPTVIFIGVSIFVSKFIFNIRTGNIQRCAGEWKCYGSTDGIIFTEIEEGSQNTRLITTDYSTGFYQNTLSSSFKTPYLYIGFTINKLCGTGQTVLNFSDIQIFGKDLLNPKSPQFALHTINRGYGWITDKGSFTYHFDTKTYLENLFTPKYQKAEIKKCHAYLNEFYKSYKELDSKK